MRIASSSQQTGGILVGQMGRIFGMAILSALGVLVGLVNAGGSGSLAGSKTGGRNPWTSQLLLQELLDDYQKMIEEGLLDPEELARIKACMDQRASNDISQAR